MSSERVLVLMAGGYTPDQIQKHLLVDSNGNRLFERTINAVPADTVWIVHNRINQGWWNAWYNNNVHNTFSDKTITLFLDTKGSKGQSNNPSLWMTSGIPAMTVNTKFKEVVFGAIDSYFDNYNFMDEFISKEHAYVIADTYIGKDIYTDLMKTTTKELLKNGQLRYGSMSQVLFQMIQKGTVFDIIKVKGKFFDCGTPDGLEAAKGYVTVGTL